MFITEFSDEEEADDPVENPLYSFEHLQQNIEKNAEPEVLDTDNEFPPTLSIPTAILDDSVALLKFFCEYGQNSVIDQILLATNLRMKTVYPDRPKGDKYDIYYTHVSKLEFYWFLGQLMLTAGWRGKFETQRMLRSRLK